MLHAVERIAQQVTKRPPPTPPPPSVRILTGQLLHITWKGLVAQSIAIRVHKDGEVYIVDNDGKLCPEPLDWSTDEETDWQVIPAQYSIPVTKRFVNVTVAAAGTYLFSVCAGNKYGWSKWSEGAEPKTVGPPPRPPPPTLQADPDSPANILQVGWTCCPAAGEPAPAVVAVWLQKCSSNPSADNWCMVHQVDTSRDSQYQDMISTLRSNSYCIQDVLPGRYSAAISSKNDWGWSERSEGSPLQTVGKPPSPPTPSVRVLPNKELKISWCTPLPGDPAPSSLKIWVMCGKDEKTWHCVNSLTQTLVPESALLNNHNDIHTEISTDLQTFTVKDVGVGSYCVGLSVSNGVGWSERGPLSGVLQVGAPNRPPPPTLTATAPSNLKITWTLLEGTPPPKWVTVWVQPDGEPTWKVVDNNSGALVTSGGDAVPATKYTCTVKDVAAGKYKAAISCKNVHGWSDRSKDSEAVTLGRPPKPEKPSLFMLPGNCLKVAWDNIVGEPPATIVTVWVQQINTDSTAGPWQVVDNATGRLRQEGGLAVPAHQKACVIKDVGQVNGVAITCKNKVGWSARSTPQTSITARPFPLSTVSPITCPYFVICREFVNAFVNLEEIKFCLDGDQCYCQDCHKKRGDACAYKRGNPPATYALPVGWSRFGIKVSKDNGIALKNWHVCYHGTSLGALHAILDTGGLKPPGSKLSARDDIVRTVDGHYLQTFTRVNRFTKLKEEFDPRQIFVSPSIEYVSWKEVYCKSVRFDGKEFKVALQLRIKPATYSVGQQTVSSQNENIHPLLFSNDELEWYTKNDSALVVTGLLVKFQDAPNTSNNNASE